MRNLEIALVVLSPFAIPACTRGTAAPKSDAPARVEGARKESDLATVVLTEQAESRLGVRTVLLERRSVDETRTVGGDLIVPPGHAITVSAPQPGTVLGPVTGPLPSAGVRVKEGEPLARLLVLPSGDLSRAREEAAVAKVRLDVSRAKARRTEQLLRDRAGSVKANEEAQAELAAAEETWRVAESRLALVSGLGSETELAALTPLTLVAPQDGVVEKVLVASGQTVAAATTLFEIVGVDHLWLRVPLYVGDLASVDRSKPARVLGRAARPVTGPPTADAASASADLFYAIENDAGTLRPGPRVEVTLPLRGAEEALV